MPPPSHEPVAPSGSWRPSDYYESPPTPTNERRGCPRWIPISCGLAGGLLLVGILALGFYLMKGGATRLINYYLTLVEREVDRNTDPGVTTQQRAELKGELRRFRSNLQSDTAAAEVQPILLELNRAVRDQRLTVEEVESLIRRLREASDRLEKNRSSVLGSQSLEMWVWDRGLRTED